jgi:hypothetical protein
MPFSPAQFFAIFAAYNVAVWPAQIVLYLLALAVVGLAARRSRLAGVATMALLALLWLWAGVVYHLFFFTRINPAAWLFGALFVLQATLFFWYGVRRGRGGPGPVSAWHGWWGGGLVFYALVVYPILGIAGGHSLRELPTLGVPCPTTLLTFGLLLWAGPACPRTLLAVPILWAAVASTAAFTLGVPQDLALVVAGLAGLSLLRGRRPPPPVAPART